MFIINLLTLLIKNVMFVNDLSLVTYAATVFKILSVICVEKVISL